MKKHIKIIIIVLVVAAAIVIAMLSIKGNPFVIDQKAQTGELTANMSREEIETYLQEEVDKSRLLFNINGKPVFEDGQGDLLIQNPAENAYAISVQIMIDETGQTVYETDILLPGQSILQDKLDTELPKGSYAATAVITAYDQTTTKQAGQSAAGLEITVK